MVSHCGNTSAKFGDADCSILLHVSNGTQYFKSTETSSTKILRIYGTFQISKPEKACLPILVKIFSGWFTFETLYVLPIVKCKCIQEKYERFTKVFQVCLICKQQRKENKSRSSSLAGKRGAVFCTLCGTIVTRKRM